MPNLDELIRYIDARAWYPLAAALLTVLIGLWRKLQPSIWNAIPTRLQWLPAVLLAGAGGFVDAATHGATMVIALVMALYAAVSGGVTSIGVLHTAKRIVGTGSAAVPLLLVCLGLSGCAAFRSTARDVSDATRDVCEAVLAQRAEVKAEAQRQGMSPLDVARQLCALNEVINPFLQGVNAAGDEAVGEAQRAGHLRR